MIEVRPSEVRGRAALRSSFSFFLDRPSTSPPAVVGRSLLALRRGRAVNVSPDVCPRPGEVLKAKSKSGLLLRPGRSADGRSELGVRPRLG